MTPTPEVKRVLLAAAALVEAVEALDEGAGIPDHAEESVFHALRLATGADDLDAWREGRPTSEVVAALRKAAGE